MAAAGAGAMAAAYGDSGETSPREEMAPFDWVVSTHPVKAIFFQAQTEAPLAARLGKHQRIIEGLSRVYRGAY